MLALLVAVVAVAGVPQARRLAQHAVQTLKPKAPPAPLRVGELPERATATSTTRRNRNGSFTTAVYSSPVNYRGSDGKYHRIDTALHPDGRDGYAWRSGANAFTARFKPSLDGAYTEFSVAGHPFRTTVVGAAASTAQQSGSTVRYPAAFHSADLTYTVGTSGVKEVIDLANADAPASYTFRISAGDKAAHLVTRRQADGSYQVFTTRSPSPVFTLDAPAVTEAVGQGRVAARPAAKATMRVSARGNDLVVTVGVDRSWLRASGRRFPVHLDPSMTVQPDTYAANFTATGTTTGVVSTSLNLGGDGASVWRAAFQFGLGGLSYDAQITSAQLGLWWSGGCTIPSASCNTKQTLDVHRVTAPWTVSSGSNTIAYDPTPVGSFVMSSNAQSGWLTWPVTSAVQAWTSGTSPNYGLLVKQRTESLSSNGPTLRHTGDSYGPKLDITYVQDGGALMAPTTTHANGADLAWTVYTGDSSHTKFSQYEVHRSTGSANFTPGAGTLLATIQDQATTSYRDTTASAGGTFTYKLVTNGVSSPPYTVTLPAQGQAHKILRPDPAAAQDALIALRKQRNPPNNSSSGYYGSDPSLFVGGCNCGGYLIVSTYRSLLRFDLRDIPPDSTINSATLGLYEKQAPSAAVTMEAHRLTRSWVEGTGTEAGNGIGSGVSWDSADTGQGWSTAGGDMDSAVAGSVTIPDSSVAGTSPNVAVNVPVTSLVQSWVAGTAPNNGVLLKSTAETESTPVGFASDDVSDPSTRPVLDVVYTDGSQASAPTVSVSAPGPGTVVTGSTVTLSAAAFDTGKVSKVEFMVDGTVVGSATAAPWQVSWNSTSVANGSHAVTARATDDAGQQTTSAAVSVTVDNAGAPAGTVSAPATSTGSVTLSASATPTGTKTISSVAFLVDGVQVGVPDTTSPYSITWNTADPLAPFFNGSHQVTASVTDSNGLVGVSPAVATTVNNTGTTVFKAGFTLNNPTDTTDDAFPPSMGENTTTATVQDPYAGTVNADGTSGGSLNRPLSSAPVNDLGTPPVSCPATAYCPTVNVTNTSGTTWTSSTAEVWYRWYAPNGAIMYEGKSATAFPATFAANASQAFPLVINPPALPPGVQQGTFRLRIDVWDPATSTWFSAKGNQPIDNPVIVAKNLATKLGLERYYQYDGGPVGAGMSTLTNVANGDMLLRWSPLYAPGRGLSTMVDLTYNSLEDHSDSPAGNNVSLSMSGLARLGEPIDIHPNKADTISGRSNKWIEVTDGDGTTHHFDGTTGADGVTRWTEPAGVNLYLRSLTGDPNRVWAFTRPDKVTYYYDADGFPTSIEDRNGNKITYTYEDTPPGENPGGPKKRITTVTDAGGRSFTIAYWSKAEIKKAHVRGNIKTITDHNGSVLRFDYYDDGNLLRLTQVGGTNADGSYLADRSIVFTYTTSKGDAPAIGADGPTGTAARLNPDPKTPNESTRLYSIIDPRQHETTFAYYLAPDGPQLRWKLKSRTDRDGQTTGYAYDLTNRITTVTAPLSRVTKYTYDTSGRVTSILDPANLTTGVQWSADNKVTQATEPTGKNTSYSYNPNGYLLTKADELGHTTALTYTDSPVDANDTGNHLSLLATVTKPNGTATATPTTDYQTSFSYDSAGNPDKVTQRIDASTTATTDYDYNLAGTANPGTLAAVTAPNGVATTTAGDYQTSYPAYDPSGQPTQVVDPLGHTTQVGYDPDGRVLWVQDPNHAADSGTDTRNYRSYFDYDTFGRLGRQSSPKSTAMERGQLLVSAVTFDANDNALTQAAPGYDTPGPVTRTTYDVMDRSTLITGPDTSADPAGERTQIDYDNAGRIAKVTKPRGVQTTTVTDDYATVYGYDVLDRVVSQTQYGQPADPARRTQMCYDPAGDLRSATAPRAGTATITCPASGQYTGAYTTQRDYDAAHRPTVQRDPAGHATRTTYDLNDNVTATETDIDTGRVQRAEVDYDQRDKPIVQRERFDGATGRNATTRIEYDADGNTTRVISPRGVDTGGATGPWTYYVTVNDYDQADRPVRTTVPYNSSDGTERQYVHTYYDNNGNTLATSLPVTQSDPALVGAATKTTMTYFDPGWVRTSNDPANPTVHFDYTATGKQASRTSEKKSSPGTLDTSKTQTWTYWPDDMVKAQSDKGGHPASYSYDADNNMTSASDNGGVTDPSQGTMLTEATFNGFDEVTKTRHKKQQDTTWTFSDYQYDANGNTTVRRENGEEDTAGTQSKAPRRYELDYDGADWLTQQRDLGTDSSCLNDTKTDTTYWGTGWEKQRDTYREDTACVWSKKKTTTWTHFDNGKLRTLTTKNGSGTTLETHTVSYFDTANPAVYVNGNRTKDTLGVTRGAGSTATTCTPAAPCDATYTYDARDKLISESRNGSSTTYTLDQPANQLADNTIRASNVTTQTTGGVTTTQRYTGTQLTDVTTGGVTSKYWYDDQGNQDCVTTSTGTQANCNSGGTSVSATVLADYHYDYLNRVDMIQQYSAGSQTDKSSYIYDALDRTTSETEDHSGTGNDRTTEFTYQGMSNLLTQEKQAGGTSPKTKTYSYDAFGHKLGMTSHDNGTGTDTPYSYGTDVHGSISQLIDDAGSVKASYGYTAYGSADATGTQSLTAGDTDNQNPTNPMRFSGRRADSGTATSSTKQPDYDMGARRYGPATGTFLQRDAYDGALADLGLATDPLTQNRYSLAGGNPISYVETDGHMVASDGSGGSARSPNPSPNSGCQSDNACSAHMASPDDYTRAREAYFSPSKPEGSQRKIFQTDAKAPGNGIIVSRLFIEDCKFLGIGHGDCRAFSNDVNSSSRAVLAWDTNTGEVSYSLSPSCIDGFGCKDAKKIGEGNNLTIKAAYGKPQGGNAAGIELEYRAENSVSSFGAIKGDEKIDLKSNGDVYTQLDGSGYPSVEINQYRAGRPVRNLGRDEQSLSHKQGWLSGQIGPLMGLNAGTDRRIAFYNGEPTFNPNVMYF